MNNAYTVVIKAEGNFVLSVCEGSVNTTHTSFFDLYRLEAGKIVEHWDTTEAIPPRSKWKNNNGKFKIYIQLYLGLRCSQWL